MKPIAAWTRKSLSLALTAALLLGTLGPDLPRAFAGPDSVDAGADLAAVSPRWTPVWSNYFNNLPSSRFEGRVIGGIDVGRVLSQVGGLQLESAEDRRAAAPMVAYLESRVGGPKAFVMLNQARRDQLMSEAAAAAAAPLRSEAATLATKVEKGQLSPDMYRYADSRLRELSRTGIYYMEVAQQHRVFAARDLLAVAMRKAAADGARRSAAQASALWNGKGIGGADNGVAGPRAGSSSPSAKAPTTTRQEDVPPSPDAYEGRILPLSEASKQLDDAKAYRAQVIGDAVGRAAKAAWSFVRGNGWMIAAVGACLLIGDNAYAAALPHAAAARPVAGAVIGAVAGFAAGFAIAKAKAPGGGDFDFSPLAWIGGGVAGALVGAVAGSVVASGLHGGAGAIHSASKTLIADTVGGVVGFVAGFSIAKAKAPGGGDFDFSPLFWVGAGLAGAVAGVLIASAAVALL